MSGRSPDFCLLYPVRKVDGIRCLYSRFSSILAMLLVTMVLGCSTTNDPPSTSSGEKLTGTVLAYASGAPTKLSSSGIQIAIQGTNFQTVSDTAGHFEIDNIPAGVYNIIFSKPGFDSMIYPVHHFIGVGTDIINDAYLVQESNDSVAISGVSYVFTVSVSKIVTVIDTIIRDSAGVLDTTVLAHDSLSITYDTVKNSSALLITGRLTGSLPPGDLFVYSSLDSTLFPSSPSPQMPATTEDAWLSAHEQDAGYHLAFQSPKLTGGVFVDTLAADAATLAKYSLPPGQAVYVYVVGHSSLSGLPAVGGEYQHYGTTPYGPSAVRFKFIVP